MKLQKTKADWKILEAAREKKDRWSLQELTSQKQASQTEYSRISSIFCQSRNLYPSKIPFNNDSEIGAFSEKKLKEFITSRPKQKEILKYILQARRENGHRKEIWGEKKKEKKSGKYMDKFKWTLTL